MAAMANFTKILRKTVEEMRANGDSMEVIAARAGISRVYLYDLLNGDPAISLAKADQIATKLGFKIFVSQG